LDDDQTPEIFDEHISFRTRGCTLCHGANINNGVLYFSYRLHGLVVELPAFSLSAKGKTELEDGMES
jgi:hypothetical protein